MRHKETAELIFGGCTLGLSLYLAFGPLRHRLPRVLTRFAKYSAALKLTSLSGLCWYGLYRNISHDGPMALRWGATVLGVMFLAAAYFVIRRPVAKRPTAAPASAVEVKPAPVSAPRAGLQPTLGTGVRPAAKISGVARES